MLYMLAIITVSFVLAPSQKLFSTSISSKGGGVFFSIMILSRSMDSACEWFATRTYQDSEDMGAVNR